VRPSARRSGSWCYRAPFELGRCVHRRRGAGVLALAAPNRRWPARATRPRTRRPRSPALTATAAAPPTSANASNARRSAGTPGPPSRDNSTSDTRRGPAPSPASSISGRRGRADPFARRPVLITRVAEVEPSRARDRAGGGAATARAWAATRCVCRCAGWLCRRRGARCAAAAPDAGCLLPPLDPGSAGIPAGACVGIGDAT
jgi:hypothetical protein